ncbi:hypothetical protein GCM10009609_75790 [Pseudonocardia aurantiaca]|uniref:Uncharacterized protein n=1 Tax=Pseudonocardia aurantiaca TaxID=75290 RepID=A0ABW4FCP7_9PSEU
MVIAASAILIEASATLAQLYAQEPRWGHAALEFEERLTRLLQATAAGLTAAADLAAAAAHAGGQESGADVLDGIR